MKFVINLKDLFTNAFDFENEKIKVAPWIFEHGATFEHIHIKLQEEVFDYQIEIKNEP